MGFLLLGVIGGAVAVLGAEAINRARLSAKLGDASKALVDAKPPKDRRSRREKNLLMGLAVALIAVLVLSMVLAAAG